MIHRHITTSEWTLMAIESLFDRGTLEDWREFAAALRRDPSLAERVRKVSEYREPDGAERMALALAEHPYGQRSACPGRAGRRGIAAATEWRNLYRQAVGPRDEEQGAVSVRAWGVEKGPGVMPLGRFVEGIDARFGSVGA